MNRVTEKPDFQEIKTASDTPPIIVEDADDVEHGSYFSTIGTFCGECWEKITTCSTSAVSKTWSCCQSSAQWTWNGIKAIPSYCVLRWDSGEEDEPREPAAVSPKTSQTVSPKASLDPDEDELPLPRWWNLGIKTAAVAAAVLILTGGYFAVKPLLFNAPIDETTADIEILEPIAQPHLETSHDTASLEASTASATPMPVSVVPEPPVAAPFEFSAPPPQQQQQSDVFAAPTPPPSQSPSLDNDPFFTVQTPPPAIPAAIPITEAVTESAAPSRALTTLQPIASAQVFNSQPQQPPSRTPLQPLAALNSSGASPTTVASAPAAAHASVQAPVASNFGQPHTSGNAVFNQAPTPPTVTALPRTADQQPIVITEPVREIIPQIQHTGMIQKVPPPAIAMLDVAEPPVARAMNDPAEPAPAIPRDAPIAEPPSVVVVPAPVPAVAEFVLPQVLSGQVLSGDTQPIDRQLWEQVHELRSQADAQPTQLRFGEAEATAEPALRFTPRESVPQQTVSSAHEDNLLVREAANSFGGLSPLGSLPSMAELRPDSQDIAIMLPVLENTPQPRWAEALPAYRSDSPDQPNNAGGLTFQSRIVSEITRTPSETETYIVQNGDTYMTISDRFYGTSLLYTALAQHNQQLGVGWRPAEGVAIEVPTAEFLRMHYSDAMSRQERRLDAPQQAVRYTVQEGDTVFRLATDRLQDSTRWREIYAMNADRLQDVRDLQPGMEILLPVRTAQR